MTLISSLQRLVTFLKPVSADWQTPWSCSKTSSVKEGKNQNISCLILTWSEKCSPDYNVGTYCLPWGRRATAHRTTESCPRREPRPPPRPSSPPWWWVGRWTCGRGQVPRGQGWAGRAAPGAETLPRDCRHAASQWTRTRPPHCPHWTSDNRSRWSSCMAGTSKHWLDEFSF